MAKLLKMLDGGYVLLMIAVAVILAMWTWVRGLRLIVHETHTGLPLAELISQLERSDVTRVPDTAISLTSDLAIVPTALLHNIKHNQVLRGHNIVMNARTAPVPRAAAAGRVQLTFGYMGTPDTPNSLVLARQQGLKLDVMKTSFFIGRRSIKPRLLPHPRRARRRARHRADAVSPSGPRRLTIIRPAAARGGGSCGAALVWCRHRQRPPHRRAVPLDELLDAGLVLGRVGSRLVGG